MVSFADSERKIIVQHTTGPVVIRADSEADYEKWKAGVQRAIEGARKPHVRRALVMKLDQASRTLYVYKGDTEAPTKTFDVAECEAEARPDPGDPEKATIKVRCRDGRKFSFGDRREVIEQWLEQFGRCGGRCRWAE